MVKPKPSSKQPTKPKIKKKVEILDSSSDETEKSFKSNRGSDEDSGDHETTD